MEQEKKYGLTITVFGDNPNYEAELAKWNEKNFNRQSFRSHDEDTPPFSKMKSTRVLEVMLTETEYLAIKKATLETFK